MDLVTLDHRPGGRGRAGRPEHRPPGAQAAQGRGGDLHRQDGRQARDRAGRRSPPTTTAASCSASRAGPGAASGSRRSRPAARTASATRSPARTAPWPGTASRPTSCGSAAATRPNESLIRDPALVGDLARGFINYPGGHNEGFPDTFKQCFRAFYEYIAAGDFSATPLFPTFADGHREVLLCEAILKSHREQRWVNAVDRSVCRCSVAERLERACSPTQRQHASYALARRSTTYTQEPTMQLGFVSAILPDLSLEEVVALCGGRGLRVRRADVLAARQGRAALRRRHARRRDATSTPPRPQRVRDLDGSRRAWRSAGWATIPIRSRPTRAEAAGLHRAHLGEVIAAAALLGVGMVNTFIGRDPDQVGRRQLAAVLRGLAAAGRDSPRTTACGSASRTARCSSPPTNGPAARTWPTRPAIWRRMFAEIPSPSFGLNYDPSHLVWQQMDYVRPLREFAGADLPRPRQGRAVGPASGSTRWASWPRRWSIHTPEAARAGRGRLAAVSRCAGGGRLRRARCASRSRTATYEELAGPAPGGPAPERPVPAAVASGREVCHDDRGLRQRRSRAERTSRRRWATADGKILAATVRPTLSHEGPHARAGADRRAGGGTVVGKADCRAAGPGHGDPRPDRLARGRTRFLPNFPTQVARRARARLARRRASAARSTCSTTCAPPRSAS